MMRSWMNQVLKTLIILGIIYCSSATMEETSRNLILSNNPYDHSLDTDLIAKLLLMPQRFCHPKRNSELINSLLGLPKNMNNAGK